MFTFTYLLLLRHRRRSIGRDPPYSLLIINGECIKWRTSGDFYLFFSDEILAAKCKNAREISNPNATKIHELRPRLTVELEKASTTVLRLT